MCIYTRRRAPRTRSARAATRHLYVTMVYHFKGGRYGAHPVVRRRRSRKNPYGFSQRALTSKRRRGQYWQQNQINKLYRNPNLRVGGLLEKELKFDNHVHTNGSMGVVWTDNNPGGLGSISGVAQGDGPTNRDGRIYYIKSIHVRGRIQRPQVEAVVTPPPDSQGKAILYLDSQCNGVQPAGTDIMQSLTHDEIGFRNMSNTARFRVLREYSYVMHMDNMAQGGVDLFAHGFTINEFEWNVQFNPPLKVLTDGTSNQVGNLTNYSIGIQTVSSDALDEITYQSRLRFYGD